MSYKQQLANRFNVDKQQVKQVGCKSMAVIKFSSYNLLISYWTIIGIKPVNESHWFITTEKSSPTTSKQTTQFINSTSYQVVRLEPVDFKAKLETLLEKASHESQTLSF
jgi:hypothetical protein